MRIALLVLLALIPFSRAARHKTVIPEVEEAMRGLGESPLDWDERRKADQPPLSLTASDGTGLQLVRLGVEGFIQEPLAFTELHLVFRNPEPRTLEGRFDITLPPDAAISRFAMRIGDQWQEGEVVERQAARRAYEDFLHRRQDPALMEKNAGNQFSARVFPIPAGGEKELILSYSHELDRSSDPYEIMLAGLPVLENLDVRVWVEGSPRPLEHHARSIVPSGDLRLQPPVGVRAMGLRSGSLAMARVEAVLPEIPESMQHLTVLFDTSASRALGFDERVGRLRDLTAALALRHPGLQVEIAVFDQDVRPCFQGLASDFGADAAQRIVDQGALGASDLGRALAWSAGMTGRLLVITDGIATAGSRDAAVLREQAGSLKVDRLDVIVDGGIRDEALLKELVTAGLPRSGLVLDGDRTTDETVARLDRGTLSGIRVRAANAEWVWPEYLDGVQSGDEYLIFASLPKGQAMEVTFEGATIASKPSFREASTPLMERASARAAMERLEHMASLSTDPETRSDLVDRIVGLSTQNRVLSDYTSLLVLETEQDYVRFGIDRDALADILTMGEGGLVLMHRGGVTIPQVESAARDQGVEEGMKKTEEARDDGTVTESDQAEMGMAEEADRRREDPGPDLMGDAGGPSVDEDAEAEPPSMAPPTGQAPASPEQVRVMQSSVILRILGSAGESQGSSAQDLFSSEEGIQDISAALAGASGVASAPSATRSVDRRSAVIGAFPVTPPKPTEADPYDGRFKGVMDLLGAGRVKEAAAEAWRWRVEEPGDVLALVAVGEVAEAMGDQITAARAYGSIIDLFPSRADLRRMAGERLERLNRVAWELAADSYGVAEEQRPDHPSSHQLLAYALLRLGRYEEAFEALHRGVAQDYPSDRFRGVEQILREDLGFVASVWMKAEPARAAEIKAKALEHGATMPSGSSLRFVLFWETDANDVDFHIYDSQGNHAFYQDKTLATGGTLYADVTTGYGPECFAIPGRPGGFPYTLQANYYSRGPMGYGMGTLHVIDYDGKGGLAMESRPFIIMKDHAFVDLGKIHR